MSALRHPGPAWKGGTLSTPPHRAATDAASEDQTVTTVAELARQVRLSDVQMISRAQLGHIGGDFSVTDILATLYGAVLNVDPHNPTDPGRDRLILSQGALCRRAVLHLGPLRFHSRCRRSRRSRNPFRRSTDIRTGPRCPAWKRTPVRSATGFRSRWGTRIGAKLQGSSRRTFVVLGDGELQEGSNWEAAMTASHYGLANLTAIVDRNRLQQGARTEETKQFEPLADKWASFGFEVRDIDGHDYRAAARSIRALDHRPPGRGDRQYHQGQGRVVHGGSGRMAPQGAHRRPGRTRDRGA